MTSLYFWYLVEMKIIHSFYFVFLVTVFAGCNTPNKIVKKTYAYTSIRMPGTIPVDENGKPLYKGPDTSTLVFVETVRDGIIWEHAWYGNRSFNVNSVRVDNVPVELGINKTTGEKIMLMPMNDGQLWQLLLEPSAYLVTPEELKQGEVLLEGKYKDKKFTKKISGITELSGPDAQ